jgi:hypothetical protein
MSQIRIESNEIQMKLLKEVGYIIINNSDIFFLLFLFFFHFNITQLIMIKMQRKKNEKESKK